MFKIKPLSAVFILLLLPAGLAFSQSALVPANATLSRLYEGINLYGQGKWIDALGEFRAVEAETSSRAQKTEALYWIGLAELSAGEYTAALGDMEALEIFAPDSVRVKELAYHRGRALYFLGRYDEAIISLKKYADAVPLNADGGLSSQNASKKAAALYWVGESLYAMGHLDRANEAFLAVTEGYPQSLKHEAASYRIALIIQKKVETELLNLLKRTQEESLKTMEEYELRERSYDEALAAYQKRIADMANDTSASEQLAAEEERIRLLEEARSAQRLNSLKSSAMGLRDGLLNSNDVSIAPGSGR